MREIFYISWMNYLGGFEYWPFTGWKDHVMSIESTGTSERNIFPQWPKSYDANADTMRKQSFRKARIQKVIRSQVLTREQAQNMGEAIKTSPMVQIIDSRRDRRTVIVDDQSFTVYQDRNKVHNFSFTITYTDPYSNQ